jgi:hypothetical protein
MGVMDVLLFVEIDKYYMEIQMEEMVEMVEA